jgi:hypothetical protein
VELGGNGNGNTTQWHQRWLWDLMGENEEREEGMGNVMGRQGFGASLSPRPGNNDGVHSLAVSMKEMIPCSFLPHL